MIFSICFCFFVFFSYVFINARAYTFALKPVENETRCYGEIGCLNITRDWYHLIHRPFNVFPLPRSVINTRFILYTEKNPVEGQILEADDKEAIEKTNFNPKLKTKFIIHGFIDTPLSNWVAEMRDELIGNKDLNVIVVDWAGGSLPLYTQVSRRLHSGALVAILKAHCPMPYCRPQRTHVWLVWRSHI